MTSPQVGNTFNIASTSPFEGETAKPEKSLGFKPAPASKILNGVVIDAARATARSVVINSRESVAKLSALGFDPIEQLVNQSIEIDQLISAMMLHPKPSMVVLSNLLTTKRQIAESLLKYGYNQVPDRNVGSGDTKAPVCIIIDENES